MTEIRALTVDPNNLPPGASEYLEKIGVTGIPEGGYTIDAKDIPPEASEVLEKIGVTEVRGGEIRVTATAVKEGEVEVDVKIDGDGVSGSIKKSVADRQIEVWWEGGKTGIAAVLLVVVAGGMVLL